MIWNRVKLLTFVTALGMLAGAGPPSPQSPVELTTLAGRRVSGALVELSPDHASINEKGKEVRIPLSEVLDVRAIRPKPAVPPDPRRPELTLTDGTKFYWSGLRVADRLVSVETAQLGKFSVPLSAVSSIRLAPIDRQLSDAWKDLAAREVNQDLLVIAKGNVLDHLDGTVGTIDAGTIHFVLDGEERTAKREKLFGIVYA